MIRIENLIYNYNYLINQSIDNLPWSAKQFHPSTYIHTKINRWWLYGMRCLFKLICYIFVHLSSTKFVFADLILHYWRQYPPLNRYKYAIFGTYRSSGMRGLGLFYITICQPWNSLIDSTTRSTYFRPNRPQRLVPDPLKLGFYVHMYLSIFGTRHSLTLSSRAGLSHPSTLFVLRIQ